MTIVELNDRMGVNSQIGNLIGGVCMSKLLKSLMLVLFLSFLTACQNDKSYSITFMNGDEVVLVVETDGKSLISVPEELIMEGYVFTGWYLDDTVITNDYFVNHPISQNIIIYGRFQVEDSLLTKRLKQIYHLALEAEVFTGTYEEWLESIRGEQGLPGDDGKTPIFRIFDNKFEWQYEDDNSWQLLIDFATLKGNDGKEINLIVSEGYIKWQLTGDDVWTNLIELNELVGPKGEPGDDAKEVTFRVDENHLQWQYKGNSEWINLISLSTLMGKDGTDAKEVTFRVHEGFVEWQNIGDSFWHSLIDIKTLTGDKGIGINKTYINLNGELIIEYSDGSIDNLGSLVVFYTVQFKDNQGYVIDIQHIKNGDAGIAPVVPHKTGYEFIGWDAEFDQITENKIITAIYQAKSYKISFITDHDKLIDDLVFEYNTLLVLPKPNKEGYDFIGWFIGESINDAQVFNHTPVTSDLTLYARYQLKSYTVIFRWANDSVLSIQTVLHGMSAFEPYIKNMLGYTFEGWNKPFNIILEDTTVDAILVPDINPISYMGLEDSLNLNPTTYISGTEIPLSNPIKEGYLFTGWTYPTQSIPVMDLVITDVLLGKLDFTAHFIELTELYYQSSRFNESGSFEMAIKVELDYDNQTFLLYEIELTPSDVTLEVYFGTFKLYQIDVYEMSFSNGFKPKQYFKINAFNQIEFCEKDGTPLKIETYQGRTVDFYDPMIQTYGYGYYDLSFFSNKDLMMALYIDIYEQAKSFNDSTLNASSQILTSITYHEDLTLFEAFITARVFLLDHPEFFFIDNTLTISEEALTLYIIDAYLDRSRIDLVKTQLQVVIDEVASLMNSNMNELEKVKVIHDYIINRVDYLYESDGVTPEDVYYAHNIEGVILGYGAVCEAYAETFYVIAKAFGINSLLVTGNSNNQKHMWNLVEINGLFYNLDLTWNDAGSGDISYVYFGMGYDKLKDTHTFDHYHNLGFDYLYQLPEITHLEVEFVYLFENNTYVGLYENLDETFKHMNNEAADYELYLYDYGRVGPMMISSNVRDYDIHTANLPQVNSMLIAYQIIDLGDGFFTFLNLIFNQDTYLNSDITLVNLVTVGENIIISGYDLIFSGHYGMTYTDIYGDDGSTLINRTSMEYRSNLYLDKVINEGDFFFRGNEAIINHLYGNEATLSFRVNGRFEGDIIQHVYIKHIYLSGYGGEFNNNTIEVAHTEDATLIVDHIISKALHQMVTFRVLLKEGNLSYFPSITINNTFDANMLYQFNAVTSGFYTDIFGKTIGTFEFITDIFSYEGALINLPQSMTDQLEIRINMSHDSRDMIVTDLYDINELGDLVKMRDFAEVIEGDVLVSVTSPFEYQSYVVPEGIREIGDDAFKGMFNLLSVTIPEGVEVIGLNAFANQSF